MATEVMHAIHGTGVSFASNPKEFDLKAFESLAQVNSMGDVDLTEVCVSNVRYTDPRKMPGDGLFLSQDLGIGLGFLHTLPPQRSLFQPEGFKTDGEWRHTGHLGFIHPTGLTFRGIKDCYVYHEGNHKTNWVMVVYSLIHKNSFIQLDEFRLCHVFKSNNYELRSDKLLSYVTAGFEENEVDARMAEFESVLEGPNNQLRDFLDELDGRHRVAVVPNGNKRKRSKAWEHFTEIHVRGPNGVVVATLAICNRCSTVYLTGSRVQNKQGGYDVKNHGTKTLNNHKGKCSI